MLATAFLMFGNSIFATLLALRANIEGYPNELIGLMASAYFLGFALGTFRSGPLINRIGHIRAFAALSALASACALLVLLIPNPWVWIALRATMGAAVAGLFIVVESWLNNRAANHSRGLLLSIYIMIGYLASTLGQQALKLGNPAGYELFLIVGVVLALSLVPVTLTHATHPDPVETPLTKLNKHPMPFIISSSKTSKLIRNAISKKKELYVFPFGMYLMITILAYMPRMLYRMLMRSISFYK